MIRNVSRHRAEVAYTYRTVTLDEQPASNAADNVRHRNG